MYIITIKTKDGKPVSFDGKDRQIFDSFFDAMKALTEAESILKDCVITLRDIV